MRSQNGVSGGGVCVCVCVCDSAVRLLMISGPVLFRAIRHLDGKEYRGRPLVVEESRARPPNSTKVFVGNISATCSADDLHGLFATFGRVLDCDKVKGELGNTEQKSFKLI